MEAQWCAWLVPLVFRLATPSRGFWRFICFYSAWSVLGEQALDVGQCAPRTMLRFHEITAVQAAASVCSALNKLKLRLQVHASVHGSLTQIKSTSEYLQFQAKGRHCRANVRAKIGPGECPVWTSPRRLHKFFSHSTLFLNQDAMTTLTWLTKGSFISWPRHIKPWRFGTSRATFSGTTAIMVRQRRLVRTRVPVETQTALSVPWQLPAALTCNTTGSLRLGWLDFHRRLRWHLTFSGKSACETILALNESHPLVHEAEQLVGAYHDDYFSGRFEVGEGILHGEAFSELADRGWFCAEGFIVALFVALQRWPLPQQALSQFVITLEQSVRYPHPLSFWWLFSSSSWGVDTACFIDYFEAIRLVSQSRLQGSHSWVSCPCPTTSTRNANLRDTPLPNVRVSLISNHNYIFDVAFGLQSAMTAAGMAGSVLLWGYVLAEKHPLALRNCVIFGDNICRNNRDLSTLIQQLANVTNTPVEHHWNLGDDASSRVTMSEAIERLTAVWLREPDLSSADLIVCGYPYPPCYLLDQLPGAWQKAIMLPLLGTVVSEYIHTSLQPWVYRTLQAWLQTPSAHRLQPARGPRFVFAMNSIEHTWMERVFGATPMLPFAGRLLREDVLAKVGQKQWHRWQLGRLQSHRTPRQVLFYRLFYAFTIPDAEAFMNLMEDAAAKTGRFHALYLNRGHENWELLNFNAVTMVPWDWEMVTFLEFYRLPIPLFVPDSRFMESLIWFSLSTPEVRQRQRFVRLRQEWWHGAPCHVCQGPDPTAPRAEDAPPWLEWTGPGSVRRQLSWWFGHTDYATLKQTFHFSGLPHLAELLQSVDLAAAVRAMRREQSEALERSSSIYAEILLAL